MSRPRVTVLGDTLVDRDLVGEVLGVDPAGPTPRLRRTDLSTRPGGAALAALLAARDGARVTFVTALSDDAVGAEVADLLAAADVEVVALELARPVPEKIRVRVGGASIVRWDRGGTATPADVGAWTDAADRALADADAVLVSCYGRGLTGVSAVRDAVQRTTARRAVVWDPHPRGGDPVPGVAVVTPNEAEARAAAGGAEPGVAGVTAAAEALVRRWRVGAVAVTRGANGALVTTGEGLPSLTPAPHLAAGDPCGAGDRFASAVVVALAAGELPTAAVGHGVAAASRFVADGGAAAVGVPGPATLAHDPSAPGDRGAHPTAPTAEQVVAGVRARGGTVVATGGCFDLLHAGHLQLLESARALGDALVVCLNSDASVRRLKGPRRPVTGQDDRADLLRALACVDAVVVFDEDTPVETLRRLRPDIFAKGGDYGTARIPEAALLASWGGQAVALPYLAGRSTTRILEEAHPRDH